MTRKQRQTIIEAFRLLRITAENGEKIAREISTQDIGPVASQRTVEIMMLYDEAARITTEAAKVAKAIENHIGATTVLDRVKYVRAKPLSSLRPPPAPRHK